MSTGETFPKPPLAYNRSAHADDSEGDQLHEGHHSKQANQSRRVRPLAVAALVGAILLAGCGGSSPSSSPTSGGGASASAPTGPRAGSSAANVGSTGSSAPPGAFAFARCMRANGVPTFPDPAPGGGFAFHASAGFISSPAFKAAQARCGKLLPTPGGPGGPSFPPQVTAHALAQLRTVAQCMRAHGISGFPDPRSTRPPNLGLGEYSVITDYEGAFLLFPATINMQSPAWDQAAAACGPLAESFNHPHH